jgi:aromatic-amino-acid transaminase
MFQTLVAQSADPLLSLIALHRVDPRTSKVDLGVGVYRDAEGRTPVMAAVKAAERQLVEEQQTKAYLGPEGDTAFLDLIRSLIFDDAIPVDRIVAMQTPGGTGALRLAVELAKRAKPDTSVTLGLPSWPIHRSIFEAAGVSTHTYVAFDVADQRLCFDAVIDAIHRAGRDHLVLLHGCCHNPTGTDFSSAEWARIADALAATGAVPLIDLAYHGLGDGLAADLAGLRIVLAKNPRALIAYSCDKNFALYRERTGAAFIVCESADEAFRAATNAHAIARANWSMPPDHGAGIVRTILSDRTLEASWRAELDTMRRRLLDVRQALADSGERTGIDLSAIARQRGLFSLVALDPSQVVALRERYGIYVAGSGRINVAGLSEDRCEEVAVALAACRQTSGHR